jgi:hypothetical protein
MKIAGANTGAEKPQYLRSGFGDGISDPVHVLMQSLGSGGRLPRWKF